jgi:NAD(P)-dependent dehydrogenase (short-subunit alcohol dehydrogenase family)
MINIAQRDGRGRLADKVAIVTGGGTGIGEAICMKFAREGAKVLVAGLPDDPIGDIVRAIRHEGGEAESYAGDLSEPPHAERCVDKAISTWGKLDVLVNNAGYLPVAAEMQDFPYEDYLLMTRWNCDTAFCMTKYALPHLQKSRGVVLGAGSEAGIQGEAMSTPYGGTKGWMHAVMRGLAVEQAKYGVRCNCVCPGPIDTAWTHKETGAMTKEIEKSLITATPMARRGTPEEAANVYCFLASDEASFVTGALYAVDGGISTAKGAVGTQTPRSMREPPKGTLDLRHSRDGLENKRVQVIEP